MKITIRSDASENRILRAESDSGSAYAVAVPASEHTSLNDACSLLINEVARIGDDTIIFERDLRPGALNKAIEKRCAALIDHYRSALNALSAVKQDNADYDVRRNLKPSNGPITPEQRAIRADLAKMNAGDRTYALLNNGGIDEIDAALRTDGFDALEIDSELRKRLEDRRLQMAHAAFVRSSVGSTFRKQPSLDDIAPLSGAIDENALAKVVADAAAQRERRIADAENGEKFLSDVVRLVAIMLSKSPEQAWQYLLGRTDDA